MIASTVTIDQLSSDPHPVLAGLRAESPVAWVDALNAWLVTAWDPAVRVLRDPDSFTVDDPRFSTARVIGPSMLSLDGGEHHRHRQPFAEPFRPRRVNERFEPFVASETRRLLDAVASSGAETVDLRTALAGPLATAVVAESLGLDGSDREMVAALLHWYRAIVDSVSGASAGDGITPASRSAFADLEASVLDHLGGGASACPSPTSGSSLLVEAASTADLDDREVVSNAAVLMFGGIETTEGMILNAIWHLLTNPDAWRAVGHDPQLVNAVIEESLRLEPAAAVVDRYATRDADLEGAAIAAGDMVTVSLAGANRDATVFTDPDRFLVDRPNRNRHLAFAQGPHVCVGMELARLEARVAVGQLVGRFPNLRLAVGVDDPARHPAAPRGLVFRKPRSLWATWGVR